MHPVKPAESREGWTSKCEVENVEEEEGLKLGKI